MMLLKGPSPRPRPIKLHNEIDERSFLWGLEIVVVVTGRGTMADHSALRPVCYAKAFEGLLSGKPRQYQYHYYCYNYLRDIFGA